MTKKSWAGANTEVQTVTTGAVCRAFVQWDI
jgi:hypothetical protein